MILAVRCVSVSRLSYGISVYGNGGIFLHSNHRRAEVADMKGFTLRKIRGIDDTRRAMCLRISAVIRNFCLLAMVVSALFTLKQ